MAPTLVLDNGYQPHRVVSWQRAVTMLFAGKVEVVEEYDHEICSVSLRLKVPAVVRLRRRLGRRRQIVKFSRNNVLARDKFRCQYCGRRLSACDLSLDHVVPRSAGGRTTWENIVACCHPCNDRKANRTPAEAGMTLRSKPTRPVMLPFYAPRFPAEAVPEPWTNWLYWTRRGDTRH